MPEVQTIERGALPRADQDIPPARRVCLLDLTFRSCRWPFGDPRDPDFGFCNQPKIEGAPYCAAHAGRAYDLRKR